MCKGKTKADKTARERDTARERRPREGYTNATRYPVSLYVSIEYNPATSPVKYHCLHRRFTNLSEWGTAGPVPSSLSLPVQVSLCARARSGLSGVGRGRAPSRSVEGDSCVGEGRGETRVHTLRVLCTHASRDPLPPPLLPGGSLAHSPLRANQPIRPAQPPLA